MSSPIGRILALDVGEKRIGVALSDESQTVATAYTTLHAQPFHVFVQKLAKIIAMEYVVEIVVGLPLSLNGNEGPQAARIREFIAALTPLVTQPLSTCDERYTSAEADRIQERRIRSYRCLCSLRTGFKRRSVFVVGGGRVRR